MYAERNAEIEASKQALQASGTKLATAELRTAELQVYLSKFDALTIMLSSSPGRLEMQRVYFRSHVVPDEMKRELGELMRENVLLSVSEQTASRKLQYS